MNTLHGNVLALTRGRKPGEIGRAMIRLVDKAIGIIRMESREIVFENKLSYDGVLDDLVTTGDKFAQDMYEYELRMEFPDFGIIGEEKGLSVPCKIAGHDIYFTVDPLDGTKAYKREQSHGVGTMIALVCDGEVVAAYIGDINTGEIFGYDATVDKPGTAHRNRFAANKPLKPNLADPLSAQYVYTRRNPVKEAAWVQKLILPAKEFGGFFKDLECGGGSIGTAMARLWKGEVGAAILDPGNQTPWDETPVVGISKWLGYEFFKIERNPARMAEGLTKTSKELIKQVGKMPDGELVIHKQHVPELMEWLAKQV